MNLIPVNQKRKRQEFDTLENIQRKRCDVKNNTSSLIFQSLLNLEPSKASSYSIKTYFLYA